MNRDSCMIQVTNEESKRAKCRIKHRSGADRLSAGPSRIDVASSVPAIEPPPATPPPPAIPPPPATRATPRAPGRRVKEFGLTGPAAIPMDFERGPALACAVSAAVTPDAFSGMAQRGNVARSHKSQKERLARSVRQSIKHESSNYLQGAHPKPLHERVQGVFVGEKRRKRHVDP